jgi:hypothetical protein
MVRREQYKLVLGVLLDMQACLDAESTYTNVNGHSFNLNESAGICWHVLAHTPNQSITGIGVGYLIPIFEQMGLDTYYPVEMQIVDDVEHARKIHTWNRNQYNPLGEEGKLRRKLLKDLIQYFKKELADV